MIRFNTDMDRNGTVAFPTNIAELSSLLNGTLNKSSRMPKLVPEPPEYLVITATILYIIIFILGVFGNIIVIIVIFANKNMKSTVNLFLINLCVADIFVMVICMPPTLVELHMKEVWYFGEFMCKLVPFLEFVVSSASIFTILTISIERYRVVCYPLSINKGNRRKFIWIVLVIWLLAILTSAPILPIIVFRGSYLKDGTPIQVCRIPVREMWHKVYFITNAFFIYVAPCVALGALYFKLCKKLVPRKYVDDTTIEFQNHTQNEKLRLRWQVINIIATIVLVFFVCHLPYRVVSIWLMLEKKRKLAEMGLETYLNIIYSSRLLLYINHALNPILYNFVSTKFRMALRFLFTSKRRQGSYLLYEKRKSPDNINHKCNSVRFKNNCILLKEKTPSHESSSSSRGKRNDFSPLYANLCNVDSQDVVSVKEISPQQADDNENVGCQLTPSLTMDIKASTPPTLRVKLQTKEGFLLGITVEKIHHPTTKKKEKKHDCR